MIVEPQPQSHAAHAPRAAQSPFATHYKAALAHLAAGRHEKAAQRFKQAAIADPEKWCDQAHKFARTGHTDMALGALQQVIALHQDRPEVLAAAWCGVGNIHYDLGDTDLAAEHFRTSWRHWHTAGAAANLSLVSLRQGNLEEADHWIQTSLDLNPWSAEAQMIQADIGFNKGHYREAFHQYECRWRSKLQGLKKIPSNKPEWPGPGISTLNPQPETLLVVGEQGMGDIILMLRYAKPIHDLGLHQIWIVHPPLKTLAQSLGIIDQVLSLEDDFAPYDYQIPSASLPRVFNTSLETIPPAPYITRPMRPMRPVRPTLEVGLCWRGNPTNPNNAIRSTDLEQWKPVLEVPGVEFHSLQFGDGEDDPLLNQNSKIKIQKFPRPASWLETAQLVSSLDLIISVDTAIAHLAGAMGLPCWVALHCRPYFVYPMTLDHCPWYPSLKLFKQRKEFQWVPVFDQIAATLSQLAHSAHAPHAPHSLCSPNSNP